MILLTDLSDVLIGGLNDTAELINEKFGRTASFGCWWRYRQTRNSFNKLLRGELSEDEYYRIFFEDCRFPFTEDELYKCFSKAFQVENRGVLSVYQRIIAHPRLLSSGAGMIKGRPDIYIVSDHIAERVDEIKDYHPEIFSLMKGEFWSFDLGMIKKDPGFFQAVLKKLGVGPNEVVFIDDKATNTEAAAKTSIANITYKNPRQLEEQLREFGFVIASATE